MRRPWLAVLVVGAVLVLGYRLLHSDTVYFYLHQSELEALAQDSFTDTGIKQLSRAKAGEPHWFINSDLVSRDVEATKKAYPNRPVAAVGAYLKKQSIKRGTHDAFYKKLADLDLEGFFVNPDRHTVEFYRVRGDRRISYFYSEGGELEVPDLVSYRSTQLDPHWSLRRY